MSLDVEDVLTLLRRAILAERPLSTQAAFAKRHGLSKSYVNDVLHRRREPAEAICKALGIRRKVTYQKVSR